jgi:hypothetical protein
MSDASDAMFSSVCALKQNLCLVIHDQWRRRAAGGVCVMYVVGLVHRGRKLIKYCGLSAYCLKNEYEK